MPPERSLIFDASSLIELVGRTDGAMGVAFDQYTHELAFYEAGHSLWRDSAAVHRVSREDARDAVAYLDTVRKEMHVLSVADVGANDIFATVWDEGVTYYDASYIAAADMTGATLVTEDRGMADHTPESMPVTTADELLAD